MSSDKPDGNSGVTCCPLPDINAHTWFSTCACVLTESTLSTIGKSCAAKSSCRWPSTEDRTQGRLAERQADLLADLGETLGEADRGRRLAFAGVGRGDRRDQHQAPGGAAVVARGFFLPVHSLRGEPVLAEMSVFSDTQHATEYHVSRMEALKILELAAAQPPGEACS